MFNCLTILYLYNLTLTRRPGPKPFCLIVFFGCPDGDRWHTMKYKSTMLRIIRDKVETILFFLSSGQPLS